MTKKKKSNWLLITLFVIFFSAVLGLTIWGVINKDKVKQLLNKNSTLYTKSEVEEIAKENYNKGLGDRSTYEKLINELKVELVNERSDKQKLANEKQELLAQHERDLEMIAQKETEINNRIQRISELEAKIAKYEKLISDTELEGYVTVLFVVNDEVYESQVIEQYSTAKFPTIDPAIEGYEFDGWTLDHNTIIDDISGLSVISDTVYYAKLTQYYKVNLFVGNELSNQIKVKPSAISETYSFADYYNDNYTFTSHINSNEIKEYRFTSSGTDYYYDYNPFEFIGWSTSPSLEVTIINKLHDNINLYAVFRRQVNMFLQPVNDTSNKLSSGYLYNTFPDGFNSNASLSLFEYINHNDIRLQAITSITSIEIEYKKACFSKIDSDDRVPAVYISGENLSVSLDLNNLPEESITYKFNYSDREAQLNINNSDKWTLTQNLNSGDNAFEKYKSNKKDIIYISVRFSGYRIINDARAITLCVPKGE